MLKCLLVSRKLYDYLENNLSDTDKIKLEAHINVCPKCKQRFEQIKTTLGLVAQEKAPQPDPEFWHNFKIDLDRRLNQRLVPPIILERRLSYRLKPALAYTLAFIFILVIGTYFYKNYTSGISLAKEEKVLIEEIAMLDEISQAPYLNHYEDAYLEEMDLLYELNQDLT